MTTLEKVKSTKGNIRVMLNKVEEAQASWKSCFTKTANYFLSCPPLLSDWPQIHHLAHVCLSWPCDNNVLQGSDKKRWLCWVWCLTHGWHVAIAGWTWGYAYIINHVFKLVHTNAIGLLDYNVVNWRSCFNQPFIDPFKKSPVWLCLNIARCKKHWTI